MWFVLVYPSFVIADLLVPVCRAGRRRWLAVAGLGATVATTVDVGLDPVMVKLGAWVWQTRGIVFGIPVQNYMGWWLTVFVILGLYLRPGGVRPPHSYARSGSFAGLAMCSYGVFVFGVIGMALHMRLTGPALGALLATGPWLIAGLGSTRATRAGTGDFAWSPKENAWLDTAIA
jgi:uncharacterized membrane protein